MSGPGNRSGARNTGDRNSAEPFFAEDRSSGESASSERSPGERRTSDRKSPPQAGYRSAGRPAAGRAKPRAGSSAGSTGGASSGFVEREFSDLSIGHETGPSKSEPAAAGRGRPGGRASSTPSKRPNRDPYAGKTYPSKLKSGKRPGGKRTELKARRIAESSASPFVRLQKVLAESGVASRRASEEFITAGRVKVDGVIVTELGTKVDTRVQVVTVDDETVRSERKVYYMVNKPEGHISTTDDPEGRPMVIDLLPKTKERLYPVGRLDEASEGLMLVTNDGPLANKLLHPRYGVPKTYRVQVAGTPDWQALESLNEGQEFSEGTFKVDSFKILREQGESTFLEVVLREGHNREIRRLFARIGHKVVKLQRVAFGPLRISRLSPGEFRHLTTFEVRQLKQVAAGEKVTGDADSPAEKKKKVLRNRPQGKPHS